MRWRDVPVRADIRGNLGSWRGREQMDGGRRRGDPWEEGVSTQHLVPKLMRGGSWISSQEGIHCIRALICMAPQAICIQMAA